MASTLVSFAMNIVQPTSNHLCPQIFAIQLGDNTDADLFGARSLVLPAFVGMSSGMIIGMLVAHVIIFSVLKNSHVAGVCGYVGRSMS